MQGNPAITAEREKLAEPARLAWRELFEAHHRVIGETERRLREAGLPPIAWYDVLYNLYLAPERMLRHRELAVESIVSPSGLTRLLDRMEERGVLERRRCPSDRRGSFIHLVEPDGIELMRKIWAHYGAVLAEHFGPAVEGREQTVTEVMRATKTSLLGADVGPC